MAGLICGLTASAAVTMQVALHLNDVEYEMFSRWLASTAIAVDPDNPHLEASEAISVMIRVTMRYAEITGQVASQLRLERDLTKIITSANGRKVPPSARGSDTARQQPMGVGGQSATPVRFLCRVRGV